MAQLLSNLPIGAKIKFGKHSVNGETAQPIIWLVVNKAGTITLLTEKVIDFRSFDAKEPDSTISGAVTNGFGRYSDSNLGQWLNSEAGAGAWYSPQHDYDQPPIYALAGNNTEYSQRPGFLYHFSSAERNAISFTTVLTSRSWNTSDPNDPVNQKVFIPSTEEITTDWAYFSNGATRICYATEQAFSNTLASPKPYSNSITWWTRNTTDSVTYMRTVDSVGNISPWESWNNSSNIAPYQGWVGVRPAMNLPTALKISDTTDSDGCYTAVWNSAPNAPSILGVPTLYGGKTNLISWSTVNDPDGDTVTYTLECSIDGGAYSQIYSGTHTVYAHIVPFGTNLITYRVKTTDPSGASSAYTTAATMPVTNNNAPVIENKDGTQTDKNLGVWDKEIKGEDAIVYTITDANGNNVTVTESIDGVQIRSLVVADGTQITCEIKDTTWLALPNGSHTLTIRATDGIDSSVRTYTFTKLVNSFTIRNATPWASATMPTRIMLVVTRNLPSGATFKVEVCNNGFDTNPTWEDATDAVRSGLVHVFANKAKTAGQWGVLIRVTVARNGATGACYVSAIGGNFE